MSENTVKSVASSERTPKFSLTRSIHGILKMALTFGIVCFGWVLFRADTLAEALLIWQKMTLSVVSAAQWSSVWADYSARGPLFYTLNLLVAFVLVEWVHRRKPVPLEIGHWPMPLRWSAYTLVFWFIAEHADGTTHNPFIYFQF